ncbi:hypothetical protein IHQ68_04500 [Chelatococcus sambhunathii]|uniref:Uncharacterized protein n=1 Tax=Chelatococcus sambhunathii TaxID=363953 RepID=A0ABU1DCU5_9HYPH|nr:hypothetical protein [Chelatococcus sambhunathii]MDR4305886.1 hypothetical protein [Chelatococcus sambhunathii]
MSASAAEIVRMRLLGASYAQITSATGVSKTAIGTALAGAGLIRPRGRGTPDEAAALRHRGHSYEEIAAALGVSKRRVGNLLSAAAAIGVKVFGGSGPRFDYSAIATMKAAGMSHVAIREETGASAGTISAAVATMGAARRYTRVDRDEVARLQAAGKSAVEIAAELGCSKNSVWNAQRDLRAAA